MSLAGKNFDQLSETDFLELIEVGVSEGVMLDYKRDSYGNSDSDKKEFLKDVSSFSNTSGGHLIIGMSESEGVASAISPILDINPDKELQRFENLARDGIEPRIVGVRMKSIPISSGGHVFVIRVPKSWNPPHRVSAKNHNRFYARTSAGAYEVSVDELRVLFTSAATIRDRVRAFRAERLARIDAGDAVLPLANGLGRLVVHLVPLAAFGPNPQIDLERAYQIHSKLRPLGSMDLTPRINFDGFINIRGGTDCHGYTQIFKNGIIEATKVGILWESDQGLLIPSLSFEKWILEVLPSYIESFQDLEVPPPFVLMISLQGVRGARLGVSREQFLSRDDRPILQDTLELPEIMIENFGQTVDYQRAARPAFDALWNSAGYIRSQHFDTEGRWIGAQIR